MVAEPIIIREISYPDDFTEATDDVLIFSNVLHTMLDVGKLLEHFFQELSVRFQFVGMRYNNDKDHLALFFGHLTEQVEHYHLNLIEKPLGTLSIYREGGVGVNDVNKRYQDYLRSVIYPIYNSLLYRDAVKKGVTDPLTQLHNRATFDKMIAREISFSRRHNSLFSVLFIDLDFFKCINDEYGHLAGDNVLKKVSKTIEFAMRSADIAFRYGGEEFIILLRNTDKEGAALLAERLRQSIADLNIDVYGKYIHLTGSIGVTVFRKNDTIESLMKRVDQALYEAKKTGRNVVVGD